MYKSKYYWRTIQEAETSVFRTYVENKRGYEFSRIDISDPLLAIRKVFILVKPLKLSADEIYELLSDGLSILKEEAHEEGFTWV